MIHEDAVRRGWGLVEESACLRLRRLAAAVPADHAIVELGAHKGQSTGWLLLGAQDGHGAHLTTVDPWEMREGRYVGWSPLFRLARRDFDAHMRAIGAAGLTVCRGFATEAGKEWDGLPVGLLFHDAGHDEDEVRADLEAWLPHMAPASVVVLHDAGNPRYGVFPAAAAVLGSDWRYETPDGGLSAEPVVIPWEDNPAERGLIVARRGGA